MDKWYISFTGPPIYHSKYTEIVLRQTDDSQIQVGNKGIIQHIENTIKVFDAVHYHYQGGYHGSDSRIIHYPIL